MPFHIQHFLALMEINDNVKRSVIWFLWKQGKSATAIHEEMQVVFMDNTPSLMTISRWMEHFTSGRQSTEDLPRSGRRSTSTSSENVDRVQRAIDSDRRLTVQQLEEMLSIPHTTIHRILTVELEMARVVARWVPKLLSDLQKRERVRICRDLLRDYEREPGYLQRIVAVDESWFHYHEPESKAQSSQWKRRDEAPPIKAKVAPSAGKRMATVFWDSDGILQIDWLPEGETVNSHYFIQCLERLRDTVKRERRGKLTRGILLLQDNASSHTSHQTIAALRDLNITVLPHPVYSPDLSPCDYWLFGPMKDYLRGKHYGNLSALSSAVSQWIKVTPASFYKEGIDALPIRWQKCITLKGDYIEKVQQV
jgi:histone-lysine N-methyltransferase SETMAR